MKPSSRLHGPLILAALLAVSRPATAETSDTPDSDVVPSFLKQHCVRCHGNDEPKAELSLQSIGTDFTDAPSVKVWQAVTERVGLGEMPPEDEPQPTLAEIEQFLSILRTGLKDAGHALPDAEHVLPHHGNLVPHDKLFAADPDTPTASVPRLWRFSPHAYEELMNELADRARIAQPFTLGSSEGFKDYAALFVVDEPTINQLMRNARAIVEEQLAGGRIKEFRPLTNSQHEPTQGELTTAIRKEFEIVLQREPTEDELTRLLALMERNIQDAGRDVGVAASLSAVFLLPDAIYRLELGAGPVDEHGRRMLPPREIAYAISYALTDSPPDGQLLGAADEGRLATKADVRREVQRILNDPKIETPRILRFFEEYFGFTEATEVFKDVKQWRPEHFVDDTRHLIRYVLKEDRDVLRRLLTTNESFVNYRVDGKGNASPARIANKRRDPNSDKPRKPEISDYYNLPEDWQWTAEQPIQFPKSQRAGILTQPAWLVAFSTNFDNHAIRRGKWIRERLLGGTVPDLPITVDAQLPDAPEKTLRERMQVTTQEYCWQCHRKMNPLGLPFETFDHLGRFRTTESVLDVAATQANVDKKGKPLGPVMREVPVDASGLVAGSGDPILEGPVDGAIELIHRLANSERVRQVFVRHAFRYWMGRNETLADGPTLVAADAAYVESGGSMNALIVSLLTSDSFLYRRVTHSSSAANGNVPAEH